MDNDKSILEKITDTVKDIAHIASEAASQALKDPPIRGSAQPAVVSTPPAGDSLASDPLMAPPGAATPVRKKKRAAPKRAAKKAGGKAASKTATKSANKAAKPASRKSGKSAKMTVKAAGRKPAKKAAKKTARKATR
jgi:hypothetical protein